MKSTFSSARMFTMTLVIVALSGCAIGNGARHRQHHPAAGYSQGDQMKMNMMAMCDTHRKMMRATTPEERNAMMDERMKSMSPEMRQKHMDMMQQRCK